MDDVKWSHSQKKLARHLFEAAVQKELAEIITEFKAQAAALSEPDEVWELIARTDQRRRDFDRKYDFRHSQLLRVFGQLLREDRVVHRVQA